MKNDHDFFPSSPETNKALSFLLDAMTENLHSPEVILTAGDIVPVLSAILGLSGKLEERMSMLAQQMAIYETTASVQAPKPASHCATKLDQRLTATSDLLRVAVSRLDQLERIVDAHDQPRKKLAGPQG